MWSLLSFELSSWHAGRIQYPMLSHLDPNITIPHLNITAFNNCGIHIVPHANASTLVVCGGFIIGWIIGGGVLA